MLLRSLNVLLVSFALLCSQLTPAYAQVAEETVEASSPEIQIETAGAEDVAAQTVVTPSLEADVAVPPALDLSDPALVEALEAREKADRAIAEAVRQQRAASETASIDNEAPAPPKTSLIPTNPDQIKALGQKVLDTVLGWLTNPAFLAQVGAIVIIWWLLAPFLAKQLSKRVFLLRDPPKEGDKLLLVRKYIFEARNMVRPLLNIGLLALAAMVLKSALGQDWLVKLAQGLAVVFLIYSAIKQFAPNELTKKLGLWVGIPLALLVVFGYFDNLRSGLSLIHI